MSEFDRLHQEQKAAYKIYEEAEEAYNEANDAVLKLLEEHLTLEGLFNGTHGTNRVYDYVISDDGTRIRIYTETLWHTWESSGYDELDIELVRMTLDEHKAAIKAREIKENLKKEEEKKRQQELKIEREKALYAKLKEKYGRCL